MTLRSKRRAVSRMYHQTDHTGHVNYSRTSTQLHYLIAILPVQIPYVLITFLSPTRTIAKEMYLQGPFLFLYIFLNSQIREVKIQFTLHSNCPTCRWFSDVWTLHPGARGVRQGGGRSAEGERTEAIGQRPQSNSGPAGVRQGTMRQVSQ